MIHGKLLLPLTATMLMLTSSEIAKAAPAEAEAPLIEKPDFTPDASGQYNIDALEALGSVKAPAVSPDGKSLLYGIGYESVEQNRSNVDLYVSDIDGKNVRRITAPPRARARLCGSTADAR